MADALAALFGQIESGNNPNAPNSSTGAQGQYQQFSAFQQQFGGLEAGQPVNTDPAFQQNALDNFAAQAITANPSISLGDLYAEYNQSTGNPGSGPTFSQLPSNVQANFNSTGVSADTPAAALMGGTAGTPGISVTSPDLTDYGYSGNQDFSGGTADTTGGATSDVAGSVAAGDNPYADVATGSSAGTPGASGGLGYVAQAAQTVPQAITNAGSAVSEGIGGAFSNAITSLESWLGNGLVMIFAIVLAAIALWALLRKTQTGQAVQAAAVKAVAA